MIGATRFASAYGSFWRNITPAIDLFVRKINLELYERVDAPCDYQVDPNRSALVSETAFALFDEHSRTGGETNDFFEVYAHQATAEARRRLTRLNVEGIEHDLNHGESDAALELFRRLSTYFVVRQGSTLVIRPEFPGCGFVDRSEGDVIYDNALFEIKAVDRNFRSVDIKQLISYTALNHKSRTYDFHDIAIYNPRRGTEFRMDLDQVSIEISGISGIDLLEIIAYSIASGEVSR